MTVNELQEPPAGRPWESERVRTWEPAPFNSQEYERYAAEIARRPFIRAILYGRQVTGRSKFVRLDPGLFSVMKVGEG